MTYAVSVQWGKGAHYFVHMGMDAKAALAAFSDQHRTLTKRQGKRGARPTVRLWELWTEKAVVAPKPEKTS
jgi:hypothetical protein